MAISSTTCGATISSGISASSYIIWRPGGFKRLQLALNFPREKLTVTDQRRSMNVETLNHLECLRSWDTSALNVPPGCRYLREQRQLDNYSIAVVNIAIPDIAQHRHTDTGVDKLAFLGGRRRDKAPRTPISSTKYGKQSPIIGQSDWPSAKSRLHVQFSTFCGTCLVKISV